MKIEDRDPKKFKSPALDEHIGNLSKEHAKLDAEIRNLGRVEARLLNRRDVLADRLSKSKRERERRGE